MFLKITSIINNISFFEFGIYLPIYIFSLRFGGYWEHQTDHMYLSKIISIRCSKKTICIVATGVDILKNANADGTWDFKKTFQSQSRKNKSLYKHFIVQRSLWSVKAKFKKFERRKKENVREKTYLNNLLNIIIPTKTICKSFLVTFLYMSVLR